MFEGKPPKADAATPVEFDMVTGDRLRPLSWHDLRMRLDEANFLRRPSFDEAGDGAQEASFDALHARRFATHQGGKDAVYPDDSTKRKGTGRTSQPAADTPQAGTRGNK